MSMDLSEFFEVFFEEAEELLADMERLLLSLDLDALDNEELNAIFRAAHSIKGGASTFGMPEITEVTHVLETLLDKIRKGILGMTHEHVDAFLAAKDVLRAMIEARRTSTAADAQAATDVMSVLNQLAQAAAAPVASSEPAGTTQPEPPAGDAGNEALVQQALMDESFGLFAPPAPSAPLASSAASPDGVAPTPETIRPAVAQIKPDVSDLVTKAAADKPAIKPAVSRESDKPKSGSESSTIRVGVEKVDELINQVGELVITHAMIEQLSKDLDPVVHQRLLNSVTQLARNTRELQESVLGIRMLPMDIVFSRFPRMVRDLAAKLGKSVELITVGAATELDKSLTERLVDPLTHLVRNSIDHGIEMPDVRERAGKSPAGRLTLSAAHQGGSIVIEVIDDGAGLNRERILAKARTQGIAVSDNASDEDIWQLIFAPGFSTAEQVTDVSGRGVGMDVVKRNITSMGGSVEIQSAKGFGSTIRIALPLTLAILDGMSVKVGDEIYILGLSSVVESLQPACASVKEMPGQGRVIRVRDEFLPILPLHELFGIEPRFTHPSEAIVVILEAEGRKVGLLVDELVGQQQVVVKSLETNYRRVTGISGATILGDGSVALILDVPTLVRQSRQTANEAATV